MVILFADVYKLMQSALMAANCHTKSLLNINLSEYQRSIETLDC